MLYRWTIILCLFLFSVNSTLADTKKTKKTTIKGGKKEKPPFTKEMIDFTVDGIRKTVLEDKNNNGLPLKARQLVGFSNSFAFYAKHEDIEKLTRISRKWFAKCSKLLNAMYKPRDAMDTAILNRNKKAYHLAEKDYKILWKKFKKLIKNPEKAKKKKRKNRH